MQGRHFAIIGRILAASLAHEGAGFAFLSDAVYEYVITGDVTDITVTLDDIPEADVQHWIKQVLLQDIFQRIKLVPFRSILLLLTLNYSRFLKISTVIWSRPFAMQVTTRSSHPSLSRKKNLFAIASFFTSLSFASRQNWINCGTA